MKTFSQILREKALQYLDLGENSVYDEMEELEDDITQAVKEWLDQRLTSTVRQRLHPIAESMLVGLLAELDTHEQTKDVKQ
jgi:hypothetical protein